MDGNFLKYAVRELSPHIATSLKHYRIIARWGHKPPSFNFLSLDWQVKDTVYAMARTKSKNPANSAKPPAGKPVEVQWLNYKFSQDDVAIVLEEAQDVPALCARLASVFISGDDFSVRFNPARKNFSAYAISGASNADGVRIGLSAFAGSVPEAISAILYKRDLFISSPENFTQSGQSMGIG